MRTFVALVLSVGLLSGCASAPTPEQQAAAAAQCGCKKVTTTCGCAHCKTGQADVKCTCGAHTKNDCACCCKGKARDCLCGECQTGKEKCNCPK